MSVDIVAAVMNEDAISAALQHAWPHELEIKEGYTILNPLFSENFTQFAHVIGLFESKEPTDRFESFIAILNLHSKKFTQYIFPPEGYSCSSFTVNLERTKIAYVCDKYSNGEHQDSQIWVANIDKFGLEFVDKRRIDEECSTQTFIHPKFAPNGELVVCSNKEGYWNLHYLYGYESLKRIFDIKDEDNLRWELNGKYEIVKGGVFFQTTDGQEIYFKNGQFELSEDDTITQSFTPYYQNTKPGSPAHLKAEIDNQNNYLNNIRILNNRS